MGRVDLDTQQMDLGVSLSQMDQWNRMPIVCSFNVLISPLLLAIWYGWYLEEWLPAAPSASQKDTHTCEENWGPQTQSPWWYHKDEKHVARIGLMPLKLHKSLGRGMKWTVLENRSTMFRMEVFLVRKTNIQSWIYNLCVLKCSQKDITENTANTSSVADHSIWKPYIYIYIRYIP